MRAFITSLAILCLLVFTQNISAQCTYTTNCPVPDLTMTQIGETTYQGTWTAMDIHCDYGFTMEILFCNGLSNQINLFAYDGSHTIDMSDWFTPTQSLDQVVNVKFLLSAFCEDDILLYPSVYTPWIYFTDFNPSNPSCCEGNVPVVSDCPKEVSVEVDCDGNYTLEILSDNIMMIKLFKENYWEEELFFCSEYNNQGCQDDNPNGDCPKCTVGYTIVGTLPDLSENWYFDIQFLDGSPQCIADIPSLGKRNSTNILTDELTSQFTIYPNPAQNIINLGDLETADYQINIFSIDGAAIYQQNITAYEDRSIDVAHLQNGTYLMQLTNTNTNKTSVQKFSVFK